MSHRNPYTERVPVHTSLPPDIDARLSSLGESLAAACPAIAFAYLFGSASTGRLRPSSDIDLAIYVEDSADAHLVRLEAARVTARHLGTDAVDVVLLNTAPISLAGRILTTRRVIADRQPFARHRYESLTMRMFHDFRIREHRLLSRRYARG